jgi:hypothetical protein
MSEPFGKPIHLGDWYDGPVYAIYTNVPHIVGPYNTFLLFKGTKDACARQYARWVKYPNEFDAFAFAHRR